MVKKYEYTLFYTAIFMVAFSPAAQLAYAQNPGVEKNPYSLDLGFERKGKVSGILVKVGDRVKPGNILIELDAAELLAQLHDAEATVQIQQAKLKALTGAVNKRAQIKRDAAQDAFEDAQVALVDAIQDAYTKADDAVRNKVDMLFSTPKSANPRLNAPSSVDPQIQIDLMNKRATVEKLLTDWGAATNALVPSNMMSAYVLTAKRNLLQVRSLLDDMTALVDNIAPDSIYSAITIRNWRTDISSGRTNIGTAIKGISSADAKIRETRAKLILAEDDLANLHTESQQVQQEAALQSAQAKKEMIQVQIDKTRLTAPVAGKIIRQDAKIGTLILNSAPVVSLMPDKITQH